MSTAVSVLVGVVLANLVVICGMFLVQVVRAPALLHAEQQGHIGDITLQLEAFSRSQQQRDALRLTIARAKFLERACLEKSDPEVLNSEVAAWQERALGQMHELDTGFSHLFHAATEIDYQPDPQEMRQHDMIRDQYMRLLRLLRAKRRVVEDYLAEITPPPR